jgi:hypothetical protein
MSIQFHTKMTNFGPAVLVAAWLASGCGVDAIDGNEVAGPAVSPQPGPSFTDEQQLLDWLAQSAAEIPLESALVHRDASGRVTSVDYTSDQDRLALLERLGGEAGYFTLAGQRHGVDFLRRGESTTPEPGDPAVETAQEALVTGGLPVSRDLCSGSFCTRNRSWNDHFGISRLSRHAVGASTQQTSGGWRETTYAPFPDPNFVCRTRCNGTPHICRPGDYRRPGSRGGPEACVHREGQNTLVLEAYWFSKRRVAYNQATVGRNVSGVALERSSFGALTGDCRLPPGSRETAECEIDGICAHHNSGGTGGATLVVTGAGGYDCPFR